MNERRDGRLTDDRVRPVGDNRSCRPFEHTLEQAVRVDEQCSGSTVARLEIFEERSRQHRTAHRHAPQIYHPAV